MIPRLSQLARHLSRPRPALGHIPAVSISGTRSSGPASGIMASVEERSSRTITTAACLIIGDEVLGGKTKDTNSRYMAKWCFSLGMSLKRIEVIEDDEAEIIEAVRRMSDRYDLVVTSGGIGPTHDDITYQSVAKAFGLDLILHEGAYERMKKLSKPKHWEPEFNWDVDSPARSAKLRMVQLPIDPSRNLAKQALFVSDTLWVPISVVNGNVYVLPGLPKLFEPMLGGLKQFIIDRLVDPEGKGISRIIISTPMPESSVAAYLTELAARVEPKGVKVGSYPRWGSKNNSVTLVGRDAEYLESLVPEVVENVRGKRVSVEGEDDEPETAT